MSTSSTHLRSPNLCLTVTFALTRSVSVSGEGRAHLPCSALPRTLDHIPPSPSISNIPPDGPSRKSMSRSANWMGFQCHRDYGPRYCVPCCRVKSPNLRPPTMAAPRSRSRRILRSASLTSLASTLVALAIHNHLIPHTLGSWCPCRQGDFGTREGDCARRRASGHSSKIALPGQRRCLR
ncbi:hypothetical protein C8F01DRAFT_561765 [Mycena amicta]|nr:hypothetical protein C8F01DRAFT_561765 [Mycena amicta]